MQWVVGVTSAPRPEPTLERTLASLERAGFDERYVFNDAQRRGAWPNWLKALRSLVAVGADTLLVCQDDVVFCRGLRAYLERTLWPGDGPRGAEPGRLALCSPYCPTPYRQEQRGWHRQNRGWHLVGALCWAIPRTAALAMLADLRSLEADRRIDARVGQWAVRTGRSVWYHFPSLAQHIGLGNSALGDKNWDSLRRAASFIGEDATP